MLQCLPHQTCSKLISSFITRVEGQATDGTRILDPDIEVVTPAGFIYAFDLKKHNGGGTFRGIHVHVVNIPPCSRMSPTRLIQLVIQHSAPKCLIYEIKDKPVCPVFIHSILLPTTRLGHRGSSYSHRIHSLTHSHLRASQSTSCACCVDRNWSTSRTCRGPLEMEAKTQNLLSVL